MRAGCPRGRREGGGDDGGHDGAKMMLGITTAAAFRIDHRHDETVVCFIDAGETPAREGSSAESAKQSHAHKDTTHWQIV